jgi:putative ABC transport system permease protein
VLKGKLSGSAHGGILRRGLIIVQFITAIILIICTYVVYHQIQFLRTQSLGFTVDEVLMVKAPLKKDSLYTQQLRSFKSEVLQLPSVSAVTAIQESPGAPIIGYLNGIRRIGTQEDVVKQFQVVSIDEDFTKVFNINTVAGRMYGPADVENYSLIMINEMASNSLGFSSPEEAVNQKIVWPGDTLTIIGVLQNYHHETMKFPVSPILFPLDPTLGLFLPVRLKGGTPAESISALEDLYNQYFPGNPFSAYFLNAHYEQQYRSDIRFGKVVGIFSAVAIIITCLGLFGLSSYTVILRMKEIGIRKVLGASDTSIVGLLCRDYTVLITIAIILAIPSAWYVMNGWLENFANRVPLSAWLFAIPSVVVILIAWLTISGHVLRAAGSNPVDIIRHE